LRIASEPGAGTVIELWLPQASEDLSTASETLKEAVDSTAKGRALLVDDELLVRISTADMLIDLGYDVVETASAEEALELMRQGDEFDVLVTDHLMPGMTGVDLARLVRSTHPKLPILLVSGYADWDGLDSDLPRLTKPFRADELATSLGQL
jgi:CheY-like chemotaxis protein